MHFAFTAPIARPALSPVLANFDPLATIAAFPAPFPVYVAACAIVAGIVCCAFAALAATVDAAHARLCLISGIMPPVEPQPIIAPRGPVSAITAPVYCAKSARWRDPRTGRLCRAPN